MTSITPKVGDSDEQFWALYATSLPHVFGYLVRRCDLQTAEDLTQDVYTDLARRVRAGADPDQFSTGWLMSVARSRMIDHMRAQSRRDRKLSLAWTNSTPDARRGVAREEAVTVSFGDSTERALNGLAEIERCVLVLHHLDGLSIDDVAAAIGRSRRATESLLARARRKFRAGFEEASDA